MDPRFTAPTLLELAGLPADFRLPSPKDTALSDLRAAEQKVARLRNFGTDSPAFRAAEDRLLRARAAYNIANH